LDEARRSGADSLDAQRLHADVLGALGEHARRAALLDSLAQAAEGPADRARLILSAAESLLNAEDLAAATEAVARAPALAADAPVVRAAEADLAWRRGAWDEVAARYEELGAQAPAREAVEYARRRAIALDRLGRRPEALTAFAEATGHPDAAGDALESAWRAL